MANKPSPSDKLLKWFKKHGRALPWRIGNPRDPYRVVISEIMLQQTQVGTVIDYFNHWIQRFPNFDALAKAKPDQVLKAWEGLGYYNRARNLHKLAEKVVNDFEGNLPNDFDTLIKLPGIGPYSARSIGSIAFGLPLACVDGNVVRVLARLNAVNKTFKNSSEASRYFQKTADDFLNRKDPAAHNEAMMELGATVCTKANPDCRHCPIKAACEACRMGDPQIYPHFEKTSTQSKEILRSWVRRANKVLLMSTPTKSGQLKGLYELPTLKALGLTRPTAPALLKRTRAITKYRITEEIFAISPPRKLPEGIAWTQIAQLDQIPLSGPHRRWITQLLSRTKMHVD